MSGYFCSVVTSNRRFFVSCDISHLINYGVYYIQYYYFIVRTVSYRRILLEHILWEKMLALRHNLLKQFTK